MSGDVHVRFCERRGVRLPPATHLDLRRSTTHRYATTLVTLGYLEQGPNRKYRLSSRVSDVGMSLLDSLAMRSVARRHLRELRTRTGRTVSLGVLGGDKVVYIDRWQGSRQGQYAVDVGAGLGTSQPAYCTAAGKALLVRWPAAEQRELIAELRLARHTRKTITTKTALRAELERIVSEGGVAVEDEEFSIGRRAIATVVNVEGLPLAAVELAVPAVEYTRKALSELLGPKVIAVARNIGADQAGTSGGRAETRRHRLRD